MSTEPPPPVDRARLDRALVSGLAWTGAVKWGSQAASWLATLMVARVLTVEDYGIVGMASAYLGLVSLLTEFGIGMSVITLRELSQQQLKQLNGLALLFGLGGVVLSILAAYPLSVFFHTPQLIAVVPAMSVTFLITSARTIPAALLQRDLRFKLVAVLEGLQSAIIAGLMIYLATRGLRYWTLVIGAIAGSLVSTALLLSFKRVGVAVPRMADLRRAATFSWHIVGARLSWYVYSNADFFIAGRVLGRAALGAYGFAWQLASLPVEKITTLVMRVTPAVFSAVQQDRAGLRRYLISLTEGLALLTFPAAVGMALVADDFIAVALGPKWSAAVLPLRILAAYAAFRSISPLLPQILTVVGETRYARNNAIIAAVVLPTAFLIGSQWGIGGIAAAWVVAHPIVLVPLVLKTCAAIDLRVRDYFRALRSAVIASAVMAVAVLMVGRAFADSIDAVLLAAQVIAGVATYAAVLHYVLPGGLGRVKQLLARAG